MRRRLITIMVVAAMILSSFTPAAFAASKGTKKMTVYSTIKKGNVVYCADRMLTGIYKVDLRTKGIKKITSRYGEWMSIHKGYLYFYRYTGNSSKLCRVKLSNNKVSTIFNCNGADIHYAISKSRIYTSYDSYKHNKTKRMVMKLNGKSKKSSKTKVKMTEKATNAAGYYVRIDDIGGYEYGEYYEDLYYAAYLVTPSGTILLEKGEVTD